MSVVQLHVAQHTRTAAMYDSLKWVRVNGGFLRRFMGEMGDGETAVVNFQSPPLGIIRCPVEGR